MAGFIRIGQILESVVRPLVVKYKDSDPEDWEVGAEEAFAEFNTLYSYDEMPDEVWDHFKTIYRYVLRRG